MIKFNMSINNIISQELFVQVIALHLKSSNISILYYTSTYFRKLIKINKEFLYKMFWKNHTTFYDNGSIMSVLIEKDGKPISYNEYWENGKQKMSGLYNHGKKNGIWRKWHDNGKIYCIIPYDYDKLHGFYKEISIDGNILLYDRYVNGILSPALTDEIFDI